MYLPTPPPLAGCNKKLIFKQSKVRLNSEFFLLDWLPTKAKESSLAFYLLITGRRIDGFISFPCPGFELRLPIVFCTVITITLNMPSHCIVLGLVCLSFMAYQPL